MQALVWFRSTALEPAAERKCKVREMASSAQTATGEWATVLDPRVFYRWLARPSPHSGGKGFV